MFAPVTSLGTPRAESWDDSWLAFVAETEERLGRRICGAHAPDGEPCELGSTHPNGRCRFHGGHPRIGAQPGNTNALIHGLYSRRLRQCNDTCPVWRMCPFAGADVSALSERKRPVCAYEREAYAIAMGIPDMEWGAASEPFDAAVPADAAASRGLDPLASIAVGAKGPDQAPRESILEGLRFRSSPFFKKTGATTKFPRPGMGESEPTRAPSAAPAEAPDPVAGSARWAHIDPVPSMVGDTSAVLYAMLQRATLTLSAHALTEHTEAQGERYTFRSTKMSAALSAFLRIGRELRAWVRLRPAEPTAAEGPGFGDDQERPELNEQGYTQFYNHVGKKIGLPTLVQPFLDELDAAVEYLKKQGIAIPPRGSTT